MAIRTLTEFSGTLIRMAAKAEAEARKALPPELTAVAPAPAPKEPEVTAQPTTHAHGAADVPHAEPEVEGGPGEKSESAAFSSATEVADEAAAVEKAAEVPVPVAASGEEMSETDAVKTLLDKAVGDATGTTGDRLARLRESVKAAGRQAERVRLVRVFGGEDVVAGAKKIGEHQFLVDLMPASMKQVFKDPKDEKGKGGSRGPKRPSGSTKNKDNASLEGAFSMESLAADRKNERGAGGPRKPGGPGGARPGGRPGGAGARPAGGAGRGKPSAKP